MHQSNPTAPSSHPPPLSGIFPPYQSRGWGISKFVKARVGNLPTPGHPQAFDVDVVSYPHETKHGGFYWKHKQTGSSIKVVKNF